jgi:hypothetical protein
MSATYAIGQQGLLFDGTFEELRPSTVPNLTEPAGAWIFNEISFEPTENMFRVVGPDEIPVDPTGNALHVAYTGVGTDNYHIVNALRARIDAAPGRVVRAGFDVLIPRAGVQGMGFYVSGNNSGYAWHSELDRASQIQFFGTGLFNASYAGPDGSHQQAELVDPYPIGVWQRVEVVLDLTARTYEVRWAVRGQPLTTKATDLNFRAADLDFIDHIGLAAFGAVGDEVDVYYDNFTVSVEDQAGSAGD